MANFCTKCGSPVKPGNKFCVSCGAPVLTASNQKNNTNSYTDQMIRKVQEIKENRGSSTGNAYNAGYPQNRGYAGAPVKKQKKIKDIRNVICIVLSVIMVIELAYAGFRSPGFFVNGGEPDPNAVNPGQTVQNPITTVQNQDAGKKPAEILPVKIKNELNWEKISTEKAEMPSEGGSVTLCGVTVNSGPENLSSSEKVKVTDYGVQNDGGETVHRYEISMGQHRQFEVPVAVTVPCTIASDEDVAIVHYVKELDEWVPLATEYDAENGTATAYFSSFSPLEVRSEKTDLHKQLYYIEYSTNLKGERSTRKAEVKVSNYYWSVLKKLNSEKLSDEALKFVADPSFYSKRFENYLDDDIRDASAAFDADSITWTVAAPILDLLKGIPGSVKSMMDAPGLIGNSWDYSEAFGNALGWVSLYMAVYQAKVDFEKAGGDWNALPAPAANLYKNLFSNSGTIYGLATGYGSAGFTIAFVGVTLVAFALDKAVADAQAAMEKRTAEIYDAYFEKIAPMDANDWYKKFCDAYYKSNNDPEKAMKTISKKINKTINRFWEDIYQEGNLDLLVAASEADTKNYFTKNNVFYNVTDEQKAALDDQMRRRLWVKFRKDVMPMVNKFLVERMQETVYSKLSVFTEPFNQYMNFHIFATVPDIMNDAEAVAAYTGCTFAFGVNGKPVQGWDTFYVPEDMTDGWDCDYDCTICGWLEAGKPDCLLVYESEEDMNNGNILKSIPFTAVIDGDRITEIDVTPADASSMVWGLERIEYCPYYSDTLFSFDTAISSDIDSVTIAHECEFGCDFSVEITSPSRIVSEPSGFVVGMTMTGDIGTNCKWKYFNAIATTDLYAQDTDNRYFRNSNGKTEIKKSDTLYGADAVNGIECTEGKQLYIKVDDGEVLYVYKAMSEKDALSLKTEIIEKEKPVHFPQLVYFPVINTSLTVKSAKGEMYQYSNENMDDPLTAQGKNVGFSLSDTGTFTLRIPYMYYSYSDDYPINASSDGFTVSGDFYECFALDSNNIKCSPSRVRYTMNFGEGYKYSSKNGSFVHTNPYYDPKLPFYEQKNTSTVQLYVEEDGSIEVDVFLVGELQDLNYDLSKVDGYFPNISLTLVGKISRSNAEDLLQAEEKMDDIYYNGN